MIARFHRDLAADIKDLPSALFSLETRLKVKILAIFDVFRAYVREFSIIFH